MKSKEGICGVVGFMHFYANIYGERWQSLKAALVGTGDTVSLSCLESGGYSTTAYEKDPAPGQIPEQSPGGEASTIPRYTLDSASVRAAEALILPTRGRILDACAAPGGKTLILASRMSSDCTLLANELSSERRRRLKSVLDSHLPAATRSRVQISSRDAAAMCRYKPEEFDAILLDAPCSSERHVLSDGSALAQWSPARSRNLACRQWSLLSSCFLMLAPGGCLVYSTCSISPAENDGVCGRLAEKYRDKFTYLPVEAPGAERTSFGSQFLPDKTGGSGPMYIARIRKNGIP